MIGESFGGYTVTRVIGSGGMGTVYVAENPRIGRKVAVKVLLPEHSSNAEIVERFFAEAKAAASINHPGIVEVLDCGMHGADQAFIVMEFLEGESLRTAIERTRGFAGDLRRLARLGAEVASAMTAAHTRGIVHRDLKPDNIFLEASSSSGEPTAKVLDFGIAKLLRGAHDTQKTQAGMLLGTPVYMSPEQCRAAPDIGPASDVYSLGAVLFEAAAGARRSWGRAPQSSWRPTSASKLPRRAASMAGSRPRGIR